MPRALALVTAAAINLAVVSMPLAFSRYSADAMNGSALWAFYVVITLFVVLESNASFRIEICPVKRPKMPAIPYFTGGCILLIVWVSVYDFFQYSFHDSTRTILASMMILLGVYLRIVSINTLGKRFTSHVGLIADHRLTTTGIYSIIRHPSEAGLLLIGFGVPVLLISTTGFWIALLLLMPASIYRIHLEEKVLYSEFPINFSEYKSKVPTFWPAFSRLIE